MFLLNSRIHLVIEPCSHIHTDTDTGTPYTEGTGLIWRVPLRRLILYTLGFSPRGTSAGSGYEHLQSIFAPFSRAPGINEILYTQYHSWLYSASHYHNTPQTYAN